MTQNFFFHFPFIGKLTDLDQTDMKGPLSQTKS